MTKSSVNSSRDAVPVQQRKLEVDVKLFQIGRCDPPEQRLARSIEVCVLGVAMRLEELIQRVKPSDAETGSVYRLEDWGREARGCGLIWMG